MNKFKRHLCLGTGVMVQGTNGTLVHHANLAGANIEMVFVESHNSGRAARMRAAIDAGRPAFNVIEVGTDLTGNSVDNVYPANFVVDAFSLLDQKQKLMDLIIDPATTVIQTNQGETGFLDDRGDRVQQWPQPSLTALLTTMLYYRWDANDDVPPITILCWELIENNGTKMKAKLIAMAQKMGLGESFIQWLSSEAVWCPNNVQNLICVAELALPHPNATAEIPFVGVEPPGMFAFSLQQATDPSMNPFPEGLPGLGYYATAEEVATIFRTKNRLLNALHVMLVARWLATGLNKQIQTVIEAMHYSGIPAWLLALGQEIIAVNSGLLTRADEFLPDVIRRFKNPWLAHKLGNIASGITDKWLVRVKPTWDLSDNGSNSPLLTQAQQWHDGNITALFYVPYQKK